MPLVRSNQMTNLSPEHEKELRKLVRRWRAQAGRHRAECDLRWPAEKITSQYHNGYRWGFNDSARELSALIDRLKGEADG